MHRFTTPRLVSSEYLRTEMESEASLELRSLTDDGPVALTELWYEKGGGFSHHVVHNTGTYRSFWKIQTR